MEGIITTKQYYYTHASLGHNMSSENRCLLLKPSCLHLPDSEGAESREEVVLTWLLIMRCWGLNIAGAITLEGLGSCKGIAR